MIGKTLGPYEITAKLGQGGMGEVWRATDTKLGREVAIKILPTQVAEDPERRQRFEREARAIAALNHPNIVTIYSVDEFDGQPLLVMEYVDGQTLAERIPEGGMRLVQLLDLAIPLSDALATAHAQAITHRDLKPANVMVDTQDRVKVLDFGLAKLLEATSHAQDDTLAVDITGEGRILGTAAYMSPEQAEGREVDARSDVFTLGILLYQMATGQKPFEGDTPMSTITSILRDEPPAVAELKPDLPAQLGRIVRRCLEKAPDRRYDTAKGLMFELESLREDSSELRAVPVAQIPKWPFVFGAAVIMGLLAILLFREGERREADVVPAPPTTAVEKKTIVVFPFENQGEAEDAYFAAGMTDEITTRLIGTEGLAVLSRSSAQQYDRTGKTMQQIAADLGVDYVLEGSIRWQRRSDGTSQVRVSPNLVLAHEDQQLWGQSFDRSMEEIFTIETEIATAVAREVGGVLRPESANESEPPTENMPAYHLYLRANELIGRAAQDRDSFDRAHALLEECLELDPGFAEAWALFAHANAGYCHFNWDRSPERLKAAYDAAYTTGTLAPGSSIAHLALGEVYYWGEKRLEEATAELRQALEQRPGDADILLVLAYVLRREGRTGEAIELIRQAYDLSPNSSVRDAILGETLNFDKQFSEGLRYGQTAVRLYPDVSYGYTVLATSLALLGRVDESLEVLEAVPASTSESTQQLFSLCLANLDFDRAARAADRMPTYQSLQYEDQCRPMALALLLHCREGREAARPLYLEAVELLRRVVAENPDASNSTALLARALAATGESDEALRLAERATTLFPADRDKWILSFRRWDLTRVQLLCGRPDEAEETIRNSLAAPNDVISPAFFRAAPLFGAESPVPEYRAIATMDL